MNRTSMIWQARLLASAALVLVTSPALADVKAGVDAWTAGDYERAVQEWSGPAAQGDPDAQFNLAQAHRLGRGVAADPARAEELYRQAAAQGHVKAADNYGMLLFQNGRQQAALPYLTNAAERGDPKAQYLLGIVYFNGDLVAKDWVRGYALMTLASDTGLPQARGAIVEMNRYVPLPQREEARAIARQMAAQFDANRADEFVAADLPTTRPQQAVSPTVTADADTRGTEVARSADGALAVASAADPTPPALHPAIAVTDRPDIPRTMQGPWKVQVGAFGQPGNVDRLWNRLSDHPALAGASKVTVRSGRVTLLQAGGFPSKERARAACTHLKRDGQECLVTR